MQKQIHLDNIHLVLYLMLDRLVLRCTLYSNISYSICHLIIWELDLALIILTLNNQHLALVLYSHCKNKKKINVFCVANKICTCTSYSSYKATSWILMGLCTISKYIVIDSTELSSLWQKCCTVNVHVAGQLLYYRLSYTTTAINIIIDLARWPDVSL